MLSEMPCNIEVLQLDGTAIEELPLSIENLIRLQYLELGGCKRLKSLPSSICKLKSLETLCLRYCSKLKELPNDIGALESLEELYLQGDPISELPSSIIYLENLREINFRGCMELTLSGYEFFPDNLTCLILSDSCITELPEFPEGCLSSLRKLDLSGTGIESIPASIINLPKLSHLVIGNCKRLKYLPKLQLGAIDAYGCTSLEVLPGLSFGQRTYISADFVDCFKLDQNIFENIVEDALLNINQDSYHVWLCYPGSEIPKCFNFQSMGSIVDVKLPINWSNNNILGFATCVVLSDPIDIEAKSSAITWECNFRYKDGHPCVKSDPFDQTSTYSNHQSFTYSNHVSVEFIILHSSFHELCSENEVFFEFRLVSSSLEIEKCGVHLIFGQHLEEFNRSSRVDNDEDVDEPQMIDGDTSQLIKIVKALSVNCFGFGSVE